MGGGYDGYIQGGRGYIGGLIGQINEGNLALTRLFYIDNTKCIVSINIGTITKIIRATGISGSSPRDFIAVPIVASDTYLEADSLSDEELDYYIDVLPESWAIALNISSYRPGDLWKFRLK